MSHQNLLGEPPATLLPADAEARAALEAAARPGQRGRRGSRPTAPPGRRWPSARWTRATRSTAYAFARTGYHRGLDQLRRAGWKGYGPVPWEHEPNQGFLRALAALAIAADAIGEEDEAQRCQVFLADSSATAAARLLS